MGIFDSLGTKLGNQVLRLRWAIILLSFVLVGLLGTGLARIGFDTDYRVFFSDDNPQLLAFDKLQSVYTKTDNVLFIIKPKNTDVFNRQVFSAVQYLTKEAWQIPYSTRVDSITNYQHTYADGDDLTVTDLVEGEPKLMADEELRYIKDVALNEPLLVDRLISKDGKSTGVNVTIYLPKKSIMEVPEVTAFSRDLAEKVRKQYPDLEVRVSGIIMMNNAFSESSQNDMMSLVPMMYLFLILAMYAFMRSFSATIATVFVIAFSAIAAMGVAGYFGVMLTPPSATAPTVILTLAIADSVHIIMSIIKSMQRGMTKKEAIVESLRINFQPVFLTSVTTAIGFLSLNFSDAPPFYDLGNITATGIMFAFLFSIVFLPAILAVLPLKVKVVDNIKHEKDMMNILGKFVVAHNKRFLVVMLAIVIGLAIQIKNIELNDEFVKYFDESISFRPDTDFMLENLTGIYQMEFSLGAKEAQGISDPEYLRHMEDFANWLRGQPEVIHVYSMSDIFKRLNKNMHGDDPSYYRLPEQREMAAQYLLLYEFSLPYGLDLNDRINVDKSSSRLSVTLDDLPTVSIRNFKDRAEQWLRDNVPGYMYTDGTSPVVMFAYISERNIESMMEGNIIALTLISIIIMIALRSFKIGMLSLVPNLVPAIMGFGLWAVLYGQINMAVAIIAAVSLGIIVDDTVHFLSKYFRARREKGLSAEDAVIYAFDTVGHALLITTLVLSIGFGVLFFSGFALNSTLGILTAMTIICALIADYFLLPPILLMFDKSKKKKGKKNV